MRRLFAAAMVGTVLAVSLQAQTTPANAVADSSRKDQGAQQVAPRESPSRESGNPSAPASVKLNTPTLNMDVMLDLYNKDIDFTIDYSGKALKQPTSAPQKEEEQAEETPRERREAAKATEEMLKPKEDLTSDIRDIVDTSKARRKALRQGSYTKEDADYNRALFSLQEAQRLFSERRYTEALAEINKSIDAAPNMALAYAVRGSVYFMLRQFAEAKVSWEKALELDPSMDNVRAILYRM
ncbi:MAG TPA: tetratricopeptide repeat protein [Bacteroidota bacterium]|nr:tetratricopeptide repeat protein [Bacteroidota bacterium]